ncbi:hypothetical protein ASPVEDRAFT_45120 [Aspergillus versicolor CBS 583.65]|uniref:Uncharacterized protein n=1 Tax=Aspergillus versicolor CBS 583.65 TaxID=1036611 RepID=A0A1L9PVP9_ASPVE|nr:uncharacterized protein ASPVEDRAFT_45120 [Aspergillus versicolor CBS 583.65]OJJ05620.1 hypothetical protein ASPVEDRAFT_45120 [Aspergillus versicolor CBS 583.65]
MFTQLRNFALAALTVQSFSGAPVVTAATPQPPELSYLYTAFVYCKGSLMNEDGPRGIRRAIPIVGGNFTGPRLSGSILDVGADWGTVDPKTEIFSADTRYNLRTSDGADIFVQTSGPKAPSGNLHLRLVFETGHDNYYWLNNVVAIGRLTNVESGNNSSVLRIDAWNFAADWKA